MARITVEDCLTRIPNRFQLTLVATYRARQLTVGATLQLEIDKSDKDKPTVVAFARSLPARSDWKCSTAAGPDPPGGRRWTWPAPTPPFPPR